MNGASGLVGEDKAARGGRVPRQVASQVGDQFRGDRDLSGGAAGSPFQGPLLVAAAGSRERRSRRVLDRRTWMVPQPSGGRSRSAAVRASSSDGLSPAKYKVAKTPACRRARPRRGERVPR